MRAFSDALESRAGAPGSRRPSRSMRFTKAASAVTVVVFLTIGIMPGLVKHWSKSCSPALISALETESETWFETLLAEYEEYETRLAEYETELAEYETWRATPTPAPTPTLTVDEHELLTARERAEQRRRLAEETAARQDLGSKPRPPSWTPPIQISGPCQAPARSLLFRVALAGTGFVAAVAAAEYVIMEGTTA